MADDREDVYSRAVRAGKRTYFFDVKSTRGRDLFLTITESKKHTHEDGSATFEKHKIFLYKEDFDKFMDALDDAVAEIDRLRKSGEYIQEAPQQHPEGLRPDPGFPLEDASPGFNDVDFEDLGRKDI